MSGINKLTDRQIKNLKPGARRIKIGDGDKLWLFVSPSGIRACLETHLSIMKRFNSMLAMAI